MTDGDNFVNHVGYFSHPLCTYVIMSLNYLGEFSYGPFALLYGIFLTPLAISSFKIGKFSLSLFIFRYLWSVV